MDANPQPRPETVSARFVLTTPMFLGGAGGQADGIRPPSVKGALRFWWRALNWGQHRALTEKKPTLSPGQRDIEALKTLHEEEARLFGIAADEGSGGPRGQGVFLLTAKAEGMQPWNPGVMAQTKQPGWIYALGQGLCKHEKDRGGFVLTRSALTGGGFEVELCFRPGCDDKDRQSVIQALRVFGLLGGLGSKARRGWGSVSLVALSVGDQPQALPKSQQEYIDALAALRGEAADTFPPFTAFSRQTQICFSHSGSDALALLENAGKGLLEFRSNGRSTNGGRRIGGRTVDNPETLRFWPDHDLMWQALDEDIDRLPERLIFGYPYAVQFSNGRGEIQLKRTRNPDVRPPSPKDNGYERRASPLFIHAQKLGNQYVLAQAVIPAVFLPANEAIEVQRKRGGSAGHVVFDNPNWDILTQEYLANLPKLAEIQFGEAQ